MPKEDPAQIDPAVIVDHLFQIFDPDNIGTINFKEFVLATDITSSGDPKGGFFSESAIRFIKSPNKIFQKTILNLKFKFPAKTTLLLLAGNLNFKFRIVFGNIFFWRFGDLKNESISEKNHL